MSRLAYGVRVNPGDDLDAKGAEAIARHSHYYTDVPGWLIRAEAVRYSGCSLTEYDGEEYYVTDPAVELFAFPVKRYTPCGATLRDIWSGARERFVDLRPGKQWASRTAREAVQQLVDRRKRQQWILNKQLRRAMDDAHVARIVLHGPKETAPCLP